MINAGPSQGMLARRNMGGIPARQPQPMPNMGQPDMGGGPRRMPQPMPAMPMMRSNPEVPSGGLNIGPSPELAGKLGMVRNADPITPQPGMGYLGGNPNFDERGPQVNMPIANTPPMDTQQPMRFGGMPMNIGPSMQDAQPLWKRYAMLNRGM